MAKSNEHDYVKEFVVKYLSGISNKLSSCDNELASQSILCPLALGLETTDNSLNEFVRSHQKQFVNQINYKLKKLNGDIQDKYLLEQLYHHSKTVEQVVVIVL